jgi:DNA-binding NarL/FixJ family response regulator
MKQSEYIEEVETRLVPKMKKKRILIADDNPHFANALRFMLLDMFHDHIETINMVENGDECIDELRRKIYDLVFMDINMPQKDGIEATREASQLFRDLIIVAVSFHSEMKYIIQMIEAGARSYIIKDEISKEMLEKALTIGYPV